jgi:hypothetical protein
MLELSNAVIKKVLRRDFGSRVTPLVDADISHLGKMSPIEQTRHRKLLEVRCLDFLQRIELEHRLGARGQVHAYDRQGRSSPVSGSETVVSRG